MPAPFVGNVHLDNDENWVTSGATDVGGPGSGLTSVFIDIQSEITHELGHSLGLAHPPWGTDSLMEALSWDLEDRVLTAYDIAEIQSLYDTPSDDPGVVLLFDLSGSMNWAPDGATGVPAAQQRLSIAKRAAKPFVELLNTTARCRNRLPARSTASPRAARHLCWPACSTPSACSPTRTRRPSCC